MSVDAKKRVQRVAGAILAVGLCLSVAIYLTAGEQAENPLADQMENTKAYQRSLEMYGGKANVLASEFSQWFGSLWHGRTLAFTVVVIAVLVAAIYYFIASPLPPEEK